MKTSIITIIHTVFPIVNYLTSIFKNESKPDSIKIYNIVDDSILPRILESGSISPDIIQSIYNHIISAEKLGSNIILVTCSSISEVVDLVQPFITIPIVKIDDAMNDEAIKIGKKIGVVATIKTTLNPTISQLKKKAKQSNIKIEIISCLCSKAYKALIEENNPTKHDKILYEAIEKLIPDVDVVVLAQASMARLVPKLELKMNKPVLSSPLSGVKRTLEIIYQRNRC